MQTPGKVFNDPIHGHMELHPLLIKIIDTPQFQRLRNIKQLGAIYFVYPGASHNRFEHSIGVGHLAGELVKVLRTRQPELGIDDRDVLCVQIAGLCHDLGHGPFSHLYDQIFIPKTKQPEENSEWKHETASCAMFDHLVDSNNLKPVMENYGLKLSEDLVFIKEMIAKPLDTTTGQWSYRGRPVDKSFLYEIVANEENGVDVDKFDYFARDCHHLGLQSNFDHRRFLTFARVCEVDGRKHICTRDKEKDNMLEMFHTRRCLHKRACQHKVNGIIQTMIADAFLKADGHIQFEGSEGQKFTLSTAINDMEAYTKLTDYVFEKILNSPRSSELAAAREILERIISRNLYRFLGEMETEKPTKKCNDMIGKWKEELAVALSQGNDKLTPEDLEIHVITIDYGKKDKNPVDFIHFYSKNDYKKTVDMKESKFRPTHFSEKWVRFYCKKTMQDDQTLKAHRTNFDQWCKRQDGE